MAKYYLRNDGFSAPPITIAIRQSYQCNLRCIQCGQWGQQGIFNNTSPDKLPEETLSVAEINRFITEVAPFRPYIYFTGGEPLLNKELPALIKTASSHHLLTSVSSNATLLKYAAEPLIESGLDYFYGSLDAPDMTNDEIRKGPDSFHQAVEGIQQLMRLREKSKKKLPIVQIQTIIIKENHDKLYEMAKFVEKELKPDVWGLQLCVFTTGEANQKSEEIFSKEFGVEAAYWRGFIMDYSTGIDFQILNEELKKIKRTRWKFKLRLYNPLSSTKFSFEKYFRRPDELLADSICMYPWSFAQLQPNGDIAFCGSQPDFILGNIKQNKFRDLWNNEKARSFRLRLKKGLFPVCSRCFGLFNFSKYK